MILDALLYVGLAVATGLAFHRAHRDQRHRPIAALLVFGFFADLGRRGIKQLLLDPHRAALRAHGLDPAMYPFTGALRVAFHVHTALTLAWGFGVVAVALGAFLERKGRSLVLLYGLVVLNFAAAYPWLRQERLALAYVAVYGAEVVGLVVIVGIWLSRTWGRIPGLTEVSAMLLALSHAVTLFVMANGAWQSHLLGQSFTQAPWALWWLAQGQFLGLYVLLVFVHLWALWGATPPSQRPSGDSPSSSGPLGSSGADSLPS